jgi:hypothetical protein
MDNNKKKVKETVSMQHTKNKFTRGTIAATGDVLY